MNFKQTVSVLFALGCLISSAFAQIQPGRGIQITISGVPSEDKSHFDGVYPVSESGTINMPFIGTVRAAGLRAEQLASSLESRYKSEGYYTHPTIQVIDSKTQTIDEVQVVVGGQVRRTGPVPWTRNLTIYQAIQAAGGATEFGSMKRVKLLRAGKQRQYDLTQLQFMQIPLEANDTIEVPQKNPWGG